MTDDIEAEQPLCCCEFVNNKGEKSHVMAIFCDCEELDSAVDRLFKGESVDGNHTRRLTEDVLDRLRIPTIFGGGAKRIDELFDITIIPSLFMVPLSIYVSALHPFMSLLCLIMVPSGIYLYYNKILKFKQRTQFFMGWALMSFFTMYTFLYFILVKNSNLSAEEFAGLTANFVFFLMTFFFTKQGPGFVRAPKNSIKQLADHAGDDFKAYLPLREESESFGSMPYTGMWCNACNLHRPPRAGHCRICGCCVYRLDHHCVWVDCCIGIENHHWFILCLILFLIGAWWGSLRTIVILFSPSNGIVPENFDLYHRRSTAIAFVGALYVLGSSLPVASLLCHQLWLISHNWTYREKKASRKDKDILKNLDQGFVRNWKSFLFENE